MDVKMALLMDIDVKKMKNRGIILNVFSENFFKNDPKSTESGQNDSFLKTIPF